MLFMILKRRLSFYSTTLPPEINTLAPISFCAAILNACSMLKFINSFNYKCKAALIWS